MDELGSSLDPLVKIWPSDSSGQSQRYANHRKRSSTLGVLPGIQGVLNLPTVAVPGARDEFNFPRSEFERRRDPSRLGRCHRGTTAPLGGQERNNSATLWTGEQRNPVDRRTDPPLWTA
ncbi:unnamed protein product [Boreogadus saida]